MIVLLRNQYSRRVSVSCYFLGTTSTQLADHRTFDCLNSYQNSTQYVDGIMGYFDRADTIHPQKSFRICRVEGLVKTSLSAASFPPFN
jgi:hypothetical protein